MIDYIHIFSFVFFCGFFFFWSLLTGLRSQVLYYTSILIASPLAITRRIYSYNI